MVERVAPLVALVGFKRRKLAVAGGVRVLVVRDGIVRLFGKNGRVDLDVAVGDLVAALTRTRVVELRSASDSLFIYGITDMTRITRGLQEVVVRESDGAELIGPAPSGHLGFLSPKTPIKQAQTCRAILEALHHRGVHQG